MSTERLTRSKRAKLRQRERGVRRLRSLVLVILVISMPTLLVFGIVDWLPKLKHSQLFAARVWTVKGVCYADADKMRDELDAVLGTPLALIDCNALAAKVCNDPWIEDVRVTAMYPNRLHVRIREQHAIAWLTEGERVQCVTADGESLPLPGSGNSLDLPVLDQRQMTGMNSHLALNEACSVLSYMREKHPGMYADVDCITWGPHPSMSLGVQGPSIYLHPENWRHSLSLLEAVRAKSPELLQVAGSLDLRFTNQVVLRRRNG